jgi:hypothetical protein
MHVKLVKPARFPILAQFDFLLLLHWRWKRAGVSSCLIFKYLPLTPTLSPFGGERESDANCATTHFSGDELEGLDAWIWVKLGSFSIFRIFKNEVLVNVHHVICIF